MDRMAAVDITHKLATFQRGDFMLTSAMLEFFYLRKRLESIKLMDNFYLVMHLLYAIRSTHEDVYIKYKNREKENSLAELLSDLNQLDIKENNAKDLGLLIQTSKNPKNKGKTSTSSNENQPKCDLYGEPHFVKQGSTCWKVFPECIPKGVAHYDAPKKRNDHWIQTEKGKRMRE